MKIINLMLVSIICMANMINAQSKKADLRKDLLFGLKVGFNYSNVYDTKGENFNADPKFGLATGVFLAIPIGKYIGIQPEILYSQKGFRAKGSNLDNTYKFTRTLSYIDLPILFELKPSGTITILAGPQISYLVKQTDAYANGTQNQEFRNGNPRKNVLCFLGGIDINLNHVILSGRAGWDVQDNNGDGTSTSPRYKNVWYQATIGYRFY